MRDKKNPASAPTLSLVTRHSLHLRVMASSAVQCHLEPVIFGNVQILCHALLRRRFSLGVVCVLAVLAMAKPASAYLAGDTAAIVNGYSNAFYFVSGTNGYFRDKQGSGHHTYFWQAANEIQSVIDAYEWTTNTAYLGMITNLLNGFLKNNGSSWSYNGYNDDDLWAVMAFARGGAATGWTKWYGRSTPGATRRAISPITFANT